jgi:transcriptional regulator with PAS, ATPase and Fis domain
MTERAGLFEDADQGTLFLDEIGELSGRAQAKLLRVLQEGEVRRVGENLARKVDVRIVAATNRSLEHEVQAGRFRTDLRFRLDVIRISLPPLRERVEDIPWLAARIWTESAGKVGSRAVLGDDLVAALARYDWPGNVRELQNVIASLAVHAPRRGRVPIALLPPRLAQQADRAGVRYDEARAEFERRFLRAALARAGGRRSIAAEQLGLSRQRLVKILTRLGID